MTARHVPRQDVAVLSTHHRHHSRSGIGLAAQVACQSSLTGILSMSSGSARMMLTAALVLV